MIPKVDTFSHDIADEIKRKDASLTEIAVSSNNVGNNEEILIPQKKSIFLYVVIFLLVLTITGAVGAYIYFYEYLFPQQEQAKVATALVVKKTGDVTSISPHLARNISNFVTSVSKQEKGYTLFINNYPAVFSYMTRNENDFIEELSFAFKPQEVVTPSLTKTSVATTSPQGIGSSLLVQGTTTSATTTKNFLLASTTPLAKKTVSKPLAKGSTTPPVTPEEVEKSSLPTSPFSDITLDNQNMRVWNLGTRTVIYAFVADKAVVISDTTDGILLLRNAILRK